MVTVGVSYSFDGRNFSFASAQQEPLCLTRILEKEDKFWKGHAAGAVLDTEGFVFPSARVTGSADFGGLLLQVTPDVLTPREGSLTLVECALESLDSGTASGTYSSKKLKELEDTPNPNSTNRRACIRVLDVGTGSGNILLAILRRLSDRGVPSFGVGVDVCEKALCVAQLNANSLGLAPICTFIQGAFDCLPIGECDTFDVVVSNPPYHLDDLRNGLDASVITNHPNHMNHPNHPNQCNHPNHPTRPNRSSNTSLHVLSLRPLVMALRTTSNF